MANITISELAPVETEFAELSDMELESVVGGGKVGRAIGNVVGTVVGAVVGGPIGGTIGGAIGAEIGDIF
jgi:uncharacterized membrane protein